MTLINWTQNNWFKWGYLKVFIVVDLIEDIESNYSLSFSQQIAFEEVADAATGFEPLVAAKFMIELLKTLFKRFILRGKDV